MLQVHGPIGLAECMPDQVAAGLGRLVDAGADALVFQPLEGGVDCLDEYVRYLMPLLKP